MKQLLSLLLITLTVTLIGCRQQVSNTADIQFDISVSESDLSVGDATLMVTLTDSDGNPVTDATLEVRGDMSHAGMVPVVREVEGGDDSGTYNIPFEWTMGGDWIVTLTATLPNGDTATTEYEYAISGDDMDGMDMSDDDDMTVDTDETGVTGDNMDDMVATEDPTAD